jgi:hypothetical protein
MALSIASLTLTLLLTTAVATPEGSPVRSPVRSIEGSQPSSVSVPASVPAVPRSEDEPPRWQREPSGQFLDCYDNFKLAGFPPAEANRLAHIAVYGTEPSAGTEGCHYYVVTVYYCEAGTRRYRQFPVGTICIEDLVGSCPVMTCPTGEQAYFQLTTGTGCKPDQACVWLEVSGVYSTGVAEICDSLVDCSCWPGLSCGARVCVPMSGTPLQPKGCPTCP